MSSRPSVEERVDGSGSQPPATPAEPSPAAPRRSLFVRSIYAGRDLEFFFVAAIATILIVRSILALSGWPQLGGGKIHFAHLLWGGLGMLIALILLIAMHGRLRQQLAILAAGIGFGLFIDELGKFVTSDNDYFFQPAAAIIYLVFVALFLLGRAIIHTAHLSPQSALVNALEVAKESVIRDLDERERANALQLLERCDQADPMVIGLKQAIVGAEGLTKGPPHFYERLMVSARSLYDTLTHKRWFKILIVGWFVLVAVSSVAVAAVAAVGVATGVGVSAADFGQVGQLASAGAVGILVLIGIARWPRSRLSAYRWFERATLVNILVYQFFAFYVNQLSATAGLIVVLLTYATIRAMTREEEARRRASTQDARA